MLTIIKLLAPIIGRVLEKFIPDVDARAEAQAQVVDSLLGQQTAIYDAAKTVMAADAASESWLTRSARPLVVVWCLAMITAVTFSPMFGSELQNAIIASLASVPADLWDIVKVGIGGYMLARTADKVVTKYLEAK